MADLGARAIDLRSAAVSVVVRTSCLCVVIKSDGYPKSQSRSSIAATLPRVPRARAHRAASRRESSVPSPSTRLASGSARAKPKAVKAAEARRPRDVRREMTNPARNRNRGTHDREPTVVRRGPQTGDHRTAHTRQGSRDGGRAARRRLGARAVCRVPRRAARAPPTRATRHGTAPQCAQSAVRYTAVYMIVIRLESCRSSCDLDQLRAPSRLYLAHVTGSVTGRRHAALRWQIPSKT